MQDLNDLKFFAAVVSNGGFSAAARALGLPKSRISRRVAALESQLGVRLLERSSRRFHVTDIGEDVFRHARAALCEAVAVEEIASRMKAEPQGLVRVSCPFGIDRLLAAELPNFLARHPRLRLQFLVSNRRVDLIDEAVDVALRVRDKLDTDADLQLRVIDRSVMVLVAAPSFLDSVNRPKVPAEVADYPTISHTDRTGAARWTVIDEQGREESIIHEPIISASSFPILRQAVLAGVGVAFLPEYMCREAIDGGSLERVLPSWTGHDGILHLVFTSRRGILPGVRAVIEFLAETLGQRGREWDTI